MVILWDTIVWWDPSLEVALKTLIIMFYIFHGTHSSKKGNEKLPRTDKILLGFMSQSPTG